MPDTLWADPLYPGLQTEPMGGWGLNQCFECQVRWERGRRCWVCGRDGVQLAGFVLPRR